MGKRLALRQERAAFTLANKFLSIASAGATHASYTGPAIAFYRICEGRVECCFAEYAPSMKRYEWIWPPPDWKEQDYLPGDAVPISEFT